MKREPENLKQFLEIKNEYQYKIFKQRNSQTLPESKAKRKHKKKSKTHTGSSQNIPLLKEMGKIKQEDMRLNSGASIEGYFTK